MRPVALRDFPPGTFVSRDTEGDRNVFPEKTGGPGISVTNSRLVPLNCIGPQVRIVVA
jgi:hypothetical protein